MNTKKYILDLSKLEPGDIILTGEKTLPSVAVKVATLSRFSHAALYVGGTIIEATLPGVFSKNPQRLLFDSPNQVAVLRSKAQLSEGQKRAVCSYAQAMVGSVYALNEAVTIRARSVLGLESTRKQFCSRLVAQAYEYAEFDLMNLRTPSFCTPRQLSLCRAFKRVDLVLREAKPGEIEFAGTTDPNIEHQKQTFNWLHQVRSLVGADPKYSDVDVRTINDVDLLLLSHPELDSAISNYVKGSGYLDFYKYDVAKNAYRYNSQEFIAVIVGTDNPVQALLSELRKEPSLCDRFVRNLFGYVEKLKRSDLEYFRLHFKLYCDLLTQIGTRLRAIRSAAIILQASEVAGFARQLIEGIRVAILESSKELPQS